MSGRAAAIPLAALVVSFGVVLVGGVLGRPADSSPTASPAVVLRLEGLRGGQTLDPFPGLHVTLSRPAEAGMVDVCISPAPSWTPVGSEWARRDGSDELCRTVKANAGSVGPLEVRLEQR